VFSESFDFLVGKNNILLIVCGGCGVTVDQLYRWEKELAGK
jgi:hypothetical protein